MENYQVTKVFGHNHVLKPLARQKSYFILNGKRMGMVPEPNYLNTGMALCGILKPGQTLNEFIAETKHREVTQPK